MKSTDGARAPWRPTTGELAVAGLLLVAGLSVVYFDLQSRLAFNDDWIYAWSVRRLADGQGLHAGPEQSPAAIFQALWAAAATLGNPDARLLRLTALPLLALAVWSVARISLELGADRFWALLAAAAVACAPLTMSLSTTFMTDVFYTGLLLAAAVAMVAWIRHGRGMTWCVGLMALASTQRQMGPAVAPALTAGLLLARRSRPVRPAEWRWLVVTWVGAIVFLFLPGALMPSPLRDALLGSIRPVPVLRELALMVSSLPGGVGVFMVPVLLGIRPTMYVRRPRRDLGITVAVLAAVFVGLCLIAPLSFLPGAYLTPAGLGPATVKGQKPLLYAAPLVAALEMAALLGFVAMVGHVRRLSGREGLRPAVVALLLLAVAQLAPAVLNGTLDRYFLPVAALLLPLAALTSTELRRPWSRRWAVAMIALALPLYWVGEQDYQAWQAARDVAARRAYALVAPVLVDAGYEANGVYAETPIFEATGGLLGATPTRASEVTAFVGPTRPCLRLLFAPAGDPRPGEDYQSAAPGRVVITLGGEAATIPDCQGVAARLAALGQR